jgi:hypothetical protein
MKQVWPNYSYSPTTNVLTLTGLNIDRDQLLLVTAADRGRIMYNFADSTVTASAFTAGANTGLTLVASTAGLTTTAALVIYYDDQLQSAAITGTVTVSSLPAISGTVTVGSLQTIVIDAINNVGNNDGFPDYRLGTAIYEGNSEISPARFIGVGYTDANSAGRLVTDSTPFPVRLLSTIGVQAVAGTARIGVVTIGAGTVTIGAGTAQIGSVTASISNFPATQPISISSVTIGNSVTIGSLPAISGTVTANSSNGSLTTRFGSVATANTAFATSAVTNANRKYLLIQNVTTASNVITVGIGFTPTTTQGIQLSSGAGLTFEGNYIPTGTVNLLSSVTASCFTILEA